MRFIVFSGGGCGGGNGHRLFSAGKRSDLVALGVESVYSQGVSQDVE